MNEPMSLERRIARLAAVTGPSGHEEDVRREIASQLQAAGVETREDALGNLYAIRRPEGEGSGLKVMLAAHMDEIGVMVTHIDEHGFVRFAPVGGVSATVLLGQRVVFPGGTVGAIGAEHLEDIKDLKIERMFIDVGAGDASQALEKVQIGSVGVYDRQVEMMGETRLTGKALDDRVGCAVLVEALTALQRPRHEVIAVFTVQEEVGARGARPAAFATAPDVAIAVDVTATGDTPKAQVMPMALGKGAAIKVMDNSMISHPALRRLLVERARQCGIPYQMEVLEFGGTDAGPIHTSRDGVPSAVVSIPTRYVHTPAELIDVGDARSAVHLLVRVLEDDIRLG